MTIQQAIAQSISQNESVTVEVRNEDAALREIGAAYEGDVDYARENDGSLDVWGWSESTPDNQQEFRLSLRGEEYRAEKAREESAYID